jgi:hypothetical protein
MSDDQNAALESKPEPAGIPPESGPGLALPERHMVLEGQDGVFFLTHDASRVMDQIEGRHTVTPVQAWATAMTHAARARFCTQVLGADYAHWLVPDRETVWRNKLPASVVPNRDGLRPFELYRKLGCEALHAPLFDIETLAACDPAAYFRTDTHWTWSGCKAYLARFLAERHPELAAHLDAIDFRATPYSFSGDLGSKIGAGEEMSVIGFPATGSIKPVLDNEASNVGRVRLFLNDGAPVNDRVLILHDSFGEWLTTLVPHITRTSLFVHTPDFDPDFVRRFRPSWVLCCQIERFFVRAPLNGVSFPELVAAEEARKQAPDRLAASPFLKSHILVDD